MNKIKVIRELCKLVNIKTFQDLKCFLNDYGIKMATDDIVIKALGKEVMIRCEDGTISI